MYFSIAFILSFFLFASGFTSSKILFSFFSLVMLLLDAPSVPSWALSFLSAISAHFSTASKLNRELLRFKRWFDEETWCYSGIFSPKLLEEFGLARLIPSSSSSILDYSSSFMCKSSVYLTSISLKNSGLKFNV